MIKKYHINMKTGRANICHATKINCSLGENTPHFNSKEEANFYVEKMSLKENQMFVKFAKKKKITKQTQLNEGALPELLEFKEKCPKSFAVFERKMKPGRGNFADSGFIGKEDDLLTIMEENSQKWPGEKVLKIISYCRELRYSKYQHRQPKNLKQGLTATYLESFYMGFQDCPFCSNKINENNRTVFNAVGHGSYVVAQGDTYKIGKSLVKFTDLDVHMLEAHRFEQRTSFTPNFDKLEELFN